MQQKPPDGRVRQSQLLSTFGPGSMLDLIDQAVLVSGLDFWRFGAGGRLIEEPRLRDAVQRNFAERKLPLSPDAPFREPPAGDEQRPSDSVGVQVLEFPRWFVCQNPNCRTLTRSQHLEDKSGRYVHRCADSTDKLSACVPVRFVVACKRGHLDDVAWPDWLHQGKACTAPRLRFDEGATGDFSEVAITCLSCNTRRPILELSQKDRAPKCRGQRPWLGNEGHEPCDESQRLLVRTASNGYFAQAMSALSIPQPESLRSKVKDAWGVLKDANEKNLAVLVGLSVVKDKHDLTAIPAEQLLAAIKAEREAEKDAVPEIRTAEFLQFVAQPLEKPGELPEAGSLFWARRIPKPKGLPAGVANVVLARRLREVVAQIGFTRLEPATKDLQGRFDLGVEAAPLSLQKDWVPAIEVRGEGIFVQFDEDAVHAWEEREPVKRHIERLFDGFEAWKKLRGSTLAFPGGRFYLLHSFSHLVMTAISLECGYPASSITERIYCAGHQSPVPMAAVLLSTGTSGTEGTLGGLVEEGRRLGQHVKTAFEGARLCSNDPVCAQHTPTGGDERHLEGAACHGCLFVPECSCERFNQFLDRALVVPTLNLADAAFFGPR